MSIENQESLLDVKEKFSTINQLLNIIFRRLNDKSNLSVIYDKKIGIYCQIKNLLPCFDILLSVTESGSVQSYSTLLRMIADNYSILFLLTCYNSKEEQELRYYLYLLNAIKTRSDILKESILEEKKESAPEIEKANKADEKAIEEIKNIISQKGFEKQICVKVYDKKNWKFKNQLNNDNYSWLELYKIAKLSPSDANVIFNFYSSFVHGLGIQLMLKETDDTSNNIKYTLNIATIIQTFLIRIIFQVFNEQESRLSEYKEALKYSTFYGWK